MMIIIMLNGQQFKFHLDQPSPSQSEESHATTKNRIEHLLNEILELRYAQKSLKQRNQFLETELKKEKERSCQLVQQVEDLTSLNIKSKQYCISELSKAKNRQEQAKETIRADLEEQIKQRLSEKDLLIKQIRYNNQQSEDFLRKRISNYETQYKQLEENYSQLKQLFEQFQDRQQEEKAKLISKIKVQQKEERNYSAQRERVKQTREKIETKIDRYDSLKHEYSNLLQKSAKSERRMNKINHQIEDITRQYSKKLINKKLGYTLEDELQSHSRRNIQHIDTDRYHPNTHYQISNNFSSLQASQANYDQSTRRSPFRSVPNTNNKENNSFFSNVNLITNFNEQESVNPKIQVEVIRPSMPSSDRIQTHKKKSLDHLVLGGDRQSLKPNMASLEVETPCFESRYQKIQVPKIRKINLRSKK